ncbi:hypothetical protein [Paenarthrobacter sp. YIM B13468]|uniref:hypothetical protein n=1 Tax=Paenarthrobacter TaxID=1742992 RepID=UPI003673495A
MRTPGKIPYWQFNLRELTVDTGVMTAYIVGYLITAITVFIFCLPAIVLFVILLLVAGALRVLVWPLELVFRKLRRHPKETQTDQSWLLGSG